MADRPILFSGPMVRALLAGTKTQTRRTMKVKPNLTLGEVIAEGDHGNGMIQVSRAQLQEPRIAVGDRLYVRESWNWTFIKDLAPGETLGRTLNECCEANGGFACPVGDGIVYAATNAQEHPEFGKARWKPSIHMPRYASRLTLTVTDVRVERLNECTAVDALAEGVSSTSHWRPKDVEGKPFEDKWWDDYTFWTEYPQLAYRELWEAINGVGSWESNPWVAAYTFTVERGNIDQLGKAA